MTVWAPKSRKRSRGRGWPLCHGEMDGKSMSSIDESFE